MPKMAGKTDANNTLEPTGKREKENSLSTKKENVDMQRQYYHNSQLHY
jgi:hypothetical protein